LVLLTVAVLAGFGVRRRMIKRVGR
jgi:hypothetical protein